MVGFAAGGSTGCDGGVEERGGRQPAVGLAQEEWTLHAHGQQPWGDGRARARRCLPYEAICPPVCSSLPGMTPTASVMSCVCHRGDTEGAGVPGGSRSHIQHCSPQLARDLRWAEEVCQESVLPRQLLVAMPGWKGDRQQTPRRGEEGR